MIRTLEATIDERGAVHLSEAVSLPAARRALVTILEEEHAAKRTKQSLSGETASVERGGIGGRLRNYGAEEDAAWAHLQSGK